METERFDRIARALAAAPSRRGLARLLAAAGLAAGLAKAGAGFRPASAAKKKKPKKCKPTCAACRRCRRGKCKPAQEGDVCGAGQVCQGGTCAALACDKGGPCRVFVTDFTVVGSSLGGLEGGDGLCQSSATAAGLAGTYLAWLSANGESPATRFTNREAAGPYQLVPNAADNGNPPPIVADSFADLTTCDAGTGQCLRRPIDRTQAGVVLNEFSIVWTGTRPDGTPGADTCGGWTTGGSGLSGQPTATGAEWTQRDLSVTCNNFLALYCFEQA